MQNVGEPCFYKARTQLPTAAHFSLSIHPSRVDFGIALFVLDGSLVRDRGEGYRFIAFGGDSPGLTRLGRLALQLDGLAFLLSLLSKGGVLLDAAEKVVTRA